MSCSCEACAPSSPSMTYTRAYMLQCEARWLLSQPLQQRRDYIARLKPVRRAAVEAAVTQEWQARR